MTLQLSGLTEKISVKIVELIGDQHRHFCGRATEMMPLLINGKDETGDVVDVPRTPASLAYIIERRETAPQEVIKYWRDCHFSTGDAAATNVNGDVVSVWDSQLLRNLTSQSKLINGGLALSDEQWEVLKAQKEGTLYLTADEVAEANYNGYVLQEGVLTPQNKTVGKVWDHLTRGRDIQSYAQLTYEASLKRGRDIQRYTQLTDEALKSNVIFRLYFNRAIGNSVSLKFWTTSNIADNSHTDCLGNLDHYGYNLIGVASKARVTRARNEALEALVHQR